MRYLKLLPGSPWKLTNIMIFSGDWARKTFDGSLFEEGCQHIACQRTNFGLWRRPRHCVIIGVLQFFTGSNSRMLRTQLWALDW